MTSALAASQVSTNPRLAAFIASLGAVAAFQPAYAAQSGASVEIIIRIPAAKQLETVLLETASGITRVEKEVRVMQQGCGLALEQEQAGLIPSETPGTR
jgi:hypothetical protein